MQLILHYDCYPLLTKTEFLQNDQNVGSKKFVTLRKKQRAGCERALHNFSKHPEILHKIVGRSVHQSAR